MSCDLGIARQQQGSSTAASTGISHSSFESQFRIRSTASGLRLSGVFATGMPTQLRKDGSTFLNQFFPSPIICVQQQAATDGQPVCLCCTCAHGTPLDVAWQLTTATVAVTAAMHCKQLQCRKLPCS
jgi:hypothetical protein